jgi:uncharacterized protein (TIGR03382 family)
MLLTLVASALAHQPFVVGDDASSAGAAFVDEEPEVSIVVYAEPTCEAPEVWLALDAAPGDELYFQLGIPVADSLDDWRPRIALVAPGLPDVDLGIPIHEVTGAQVFTPDAEPQRFDEPFSGTSSWILVEERVVLPEGGPAWLVAFQPDGTVARLWVAVGEIERFDQDDWDRIADLMDDVRAFHGIDGSEVPAPLTCAMDDAGAADDLADDLADGDAAPTGCAAVPGTPALPLLGLALAAVARRRRRATR